MIGITFVCLLLVDHVGEEVKKVAKLQRAHIQDREERESGRSEPKHRPKNDNKKEGE